MKIPSKQRISQLFFTLLYNPYFHGFFVGSIYQGRFKIIPCPGFNCHSCPAAVFACPVGMLQMFVFCGRQFISFYIIGFIGIIGVLGGRIVCGWACPFGFLQDLLFKIRSRKIIIPEFLEPVKYLILVVTVFLLSWYTKEPFFCKIICPAGTLEAGIPLLLMNSDLRGMIGWLFVWKSCFLTFFLFMMIVSKRPFCRFVCPLGAIYGLLNKVSLFRLEVDSGTCTSCKKCSEICPVDLKIYSKKHSSTGCIRCFSCKACPEKAVKITFNSKIITKFSQRFADIHK